MRHLGYISGPVWEGGREVNSRVNSGSIMGRFWVNSRKPHDIPQIYLHLAVGRALSLEYVKYGVLGGYWLGTGYSPPPTHPATPHPGYTSSPAVRSPGANRSVSQTIKCRGALIGSPTLFICAFLRVQRYYRGI